MVRSARGLVEFIDVYPTLADVCGLTPPTGLEGKTFRPLLDDPLAHRETRRVHQGHGRTGGGAERPHRPLAVHRVGRRQKGAELYDHADDPGEYHNLAGDPKPRGYRR